MQISSPEFQNNGNIPSKFTCDGKGINPALEISDVPVGAKSLALIMDDPDIPETVKQNYGIEVWEHWLVWNISPDTKEIKENSIPSVAVVGRGTRSLDIYTPPCPPDREHRYFFKLYALDTVLDLDKNSGAADLEKAMAGHIIKKAELIGKYNRK